LWSAEWITADDSRCVTTVSNATPLSTAFRTAAGLLKLPIASVASSKKRKRDGEGKALPSGRQAPKLNTAENNDMIQHDGPVVDLLLKNDDKQSLDAPNADPAKSESGTIDSRKGDSAGDDIESTALDEQLPDALNSYPTESIEGFAMEPVAQDSNATNSANSSAADEAIGLETAVQETQETPKSEVIDPYFFYLVKIRTGYPKRVLIPVDAKLPLRDILRGQAVLEFPSIQILTQPPESIPDKFILERNWKVDYAIQEAELHELAATDVVVEERNPNNIPISGGRIPNGADLLAILQQDIIG
jgi:hypothetical protein